MIQIGLMNMGDKCRTLPVDPNLPRYLCQNCRNYLCFDSYADKYFPSDASHSGMQGSSVHWAGSVLASTCMDHSFVVLPKQKSQAPGGPPHPRAGAVQPEASQSVRAMEESFVVLPPPVTSVYKTEPASDGVGTHLPSPEGGPTKIPTQPNNSGFHTTITVLKRAFDIATNQMQVEQPLCLECMRVLSDKLDKEVEDVSRDISAYEACLKQLEGEERKVLGEADFLKEKLKLPSIEVIAKSPPAEATTNTCAHQYLCLSFAQPRSLQVKLLQRPTHC